MALQLGKVQYNHSLNVKFVALGLKINAKSISSIVIYRYHLLTINNFILKGHKYLLIWSAINCVIRDLCFLQTQTHRHTHTFWCRQYKFPSNLPLFQEKGTIYLCFILLVSGALHRLQLGLDVINLRVLLPYLPLVHMFLIDFLFSQRLYLLSEALNGHGPISFIVRTPKMVLQKLFLSSSTLTFITNLKNVFT